MNILMYLFLSKVECVFLREKLLTFVHFKIVSSQRSVDWDIYVTVTWELWVADFANNRRIICHAASGLCIKELVKSLAMLTLHFCVTFFPSAHLHQNIFIHLCLMKGHWVTTIICNGLCISASKNYTGQAGWYLDLISMTKHLSLADCMLIGKESKNMHCASLNTWLKWTWYPKYVLCCASE